MPPWNDLLAEFGAQPDDDTRNEWLNRQQREAIARVSQLRGGTNVVLYASAFLQKPQAPSERIAIYDEDLNGFMSVIYGMGWQNGLTLILHTPGGGPNAAETIVAYLRSKFDRIEIIVPTFAMSAGTMISLSGDRIIMGRQSQLGPIDPQMFTAGRYVSARAIVEQFERGKSEILADVNAAHVWAPILQSVGPALLLEAQNALDYGESIVAGWLAKYMYGPDPDGKAIGKRIAHHFNDASTHKSHGRRIGRDEARREGVKIDDLEDDQDLQDAVLTSYHLATIIFENSPATKMIVGNNKRMWLKHWVVQSSQS